MVEALSHSSLGNLLNCILVLTSLGEKLSDDEVEELLKGVNVGKDGNINYTGSTGYGLLLTQQSLYK
jgi:hypothetical protein